MACPPWKASRRSCSRGSRKKGRRSRGKGVVKTAPGVVRHLATAVAVLMLLAACGGGAPSSETSGPTGKGPIKGQVRFSWWGTGERNQKTMQVITLFQNRYPDATVQ